MGALSQDAAATIVVAVIGIAVTWAVWVTVSLFNQAKDMALLKQQVELMGEIKKVLLGLQSKFNV